MDQRKTTQDNGSTPKLKMGKKVVPAAGAVRFDNPPTVPNTAQPIGAQKLRLSNIKIINPTKPREVEITKYQTKCFFFLVGVAFLAFGAGLTVYGDREDLRDFLVLGPGCLIIGFILIIIALALIVKDLYLLNRPIKHSQEMVETPTQSDFNYHYLTPPRQEVVTHTPKQDHRQDPKQEENVRPHAHSTGSTTSRPTTTCSVLSDGVLTTSDLLVDTNVQKPPDIAIEDHSSPIGSQIITVKHPWKEGEESSEKLETDKNSSEEPQTDVTNETKGARETTTYIGTTGDTLDTPC